MLETELLRRVLPIDTAPDFRTLDEYTVPKYDKESYEENIIDYKTYNMLTAQIEFDYKSNYLDPDAIIDDFALNFMYHPRFPKAFFNKIANKIKGVPALRLEEVESFLEDNYNGGLHHNMLYVDSLGGKLKQPDCDYLRSILDEWGKEYIVSNLNNFLKALDWIKNKREQLPPWPSNYEYKGLSNRIISNEETISIESDDLSVDLFLTGRFGWPQVDEIAERLGIIINRKYCLNNYKKSSVTGLIDALKDCELIAKKTQPILHEIFGTRYSVSVNTDRETECRAEYRKSAATILENWGYRKPKFND